MTSAGRAGRAHHDLPLGPEMRPGAGQADPVVPAGPRLADQVLAGG